MSTLLVCCVIGILACLETKVEWKQIKNTPTTLEGYGITDGASDSELADEVSTLNQAISDEATARENADETLQDNIDDVASDVSTNTTNISANATAISNLKNRVIADEAIIDSNSDNISANTTNITALQATLNKIAYYNWVTKQEKDKWAYFDKQLTDEYNKVYANFPGETFPQEQSGTIGYLAADLMSKISAVRTFLSSTLKINVDEDTNITTDYNDWIAAYNAYWTAHYNFLHQLYLDNKALNWDNLPNKPSTFPPSSHTHGNSDITGIDAGKITSGTIDLDRLPKSALDKLKKVADQTARYALTTSDVQNGDSVLQLDTGVMYLVVDDTKLNLDDGYQEYVAGTAAAVDWSGVQNKPSTFTPSSHNHGNITNDGKIGSEAGKLLVTTENGVITRSAFGEVAGTFVEGNDYRLSNTRDPNDHASNKVTAMTDYSKPSTITDENLPISTSDSLNSAVGKLEYKADNALVLAGNNSDRLDNIKVGGRNLLLDTVEKNATDSLSYQLSDFGVVVTSYNIDKRFLVSFDVECSVENSSISVWFNSTTTKVTQDINFTINGLSKNIIFYSSSVTRLNTSDIVEIKIKNNTTGNTITVKNIKLEEGNQATTYTPAPEDTELAKLRSYSKPSSTSAIATTDTIKSAIGKLEVKADNGIAAISDHETRITALENASPTPTPTPSTMRWGIKINRNDSSPATRVSYINDNANYTPVSYDNQGNFQWGDWKAFFDTFFAPVMLNSDGTEAYELNHDDQTKKLDGVTASDIDDPTFNGNAMLRIKKMWYYFHSDGDYDYFEFASHQATNDFCCDCFIDKDGYVKEQAYLGMFLGYTNGSIDGNNKIRSLKYGTVKYIQTYSYALQSAVANGNSHWGLMHYSLYFLLSALHVLLGKNTNVQAVFGNGICAKGLNFSSIETTGLYTNSDTEVAAPAFAAIDKETDSYIEHVKSFYCHDLWAGCNQLLDGAFYEGGGTYVCKIKSHPPFDNISTNYTSSFNMGNSLTDGYIKDLYFDNNAFMPNHSNGSDTTYYCDHTVGRSPNHGGNASGRYTVGGRDTGSSTGWKNHSGMFKISPINDSDVSYASPRLCYV